MRLTVIGSTGQTGRHVVAEALSRGHAVTAATRRPEALEHRDAVTVVQGDGRDPLVMRRAVSAADAVIAIVAARSPRGPHHMADVARTVVGAMHEAGVSRLVVTSAYPIVGDRPRIPMALLRTIFAANYADARAMEQVVTASDLEWTITRLNRLTDKPATNESRLTTDLLDRPSAIPRADAAAVLLDLAENGKYERAAVNVAGR
jgi:putative NADH-flavin reductase